MKIFFKVLAFALFLALLGFVIAYGRGYRWSFKNKSLTPTGIISVNSNPNAAKVFVNDQLKGVTNINLTFSPGDYKIEIKKDGYTTWSKNIKLKGELVYTADVQLFPLNPTLSPLTNLGITKTVPVDQTEKIILFSDNNDPTKDGIYLFDASKRTLSLFPPLKLLALKKDLPLDEVDFNNTNVFFSADYKEAIIDFNLNLASNKALLFSLDSENNSLFDVTNSKETLIAAYEEEKIKEINKVLEAFPDEIDKIATASFQVINFSPDKTKFLYLAKENLELPLAIKPPLVVANQTEEQRNVNKNNLYVYDKKEDKNYLLTNAFKDALWYPDSRHMVFIEGKKVAVVDYDNTNKQIIYSGPFEQSFFIITSDGKIITLSNLNPENNRFPDLYSVGIK